jgi:transcriptional regulator with XRE-family HTH domain
MGKGDRMMRPQYEKLLEDIETSIEYWSQTAILDFTEELSRLMEEEDVSRAELARRIGKSAPYVTKVLRGNVNFTLATMTRLARALGAVVRIHLSPEGVMVKWEHEHIGRVVSTTISQDGFDDKYNVVNLVIGNQGGSNDHANQQAVMVAR